MSDWFFKLLVMGLSYTLEFCIIYFYGRQSFPKLTLYLSIGTWLLMMGLSYFNGAWFGLSIILGLIYLFILRKPPQAEVFKKLYADNKIYSTTNYSQDVLDLLGDKKWRYAEGSIMKNVNERIVYGFWQGHTTGFVSAGQYTRTTVFTSYLAFVFPPGSFTNVFKQNAFTAVDKSYYSFKKKVKYFFVPDTETPNLVAIAKDGSLVIQYLTVPDAEHYSRRIEWIKENMNSN